MHFHVLGLGAIGRLVSHHLRRAAPPAHNVTIIHKTRRRARDFLLQGSIVGIERDGIVTEAKGFGSEPFQHNMSYSDEGGWDTDLPKIDSLIVATKAHHVLPAMKALLPRLSRDSTIVLLQNGMGVYDHLINALFRNEQYRPHFILTSNTHGVFIKDQELAVHAGVGELQIGIVPDPAGRDFEPGYRDKSIPRHERILRLTDIEQPSTDGRYHSLHETVSVLTSIEQLNVSWKPISEVQLAMRRKLVVNAAISTLTALFGCRNGDLLKSDAAKILMKRICSEAARLFAAEHAAEAQRWLDGFSQDGLDTDILSVDRFPECLTKESLLEEVTRVAELTKGNISSMLLDIQSGKNTELRYITGYLLNLGRAYKVKAPNIATLHFLVKARSDIPIDQML